MKKVSIGAVALALITPVGLNAVTAPSQSVSAKTVKIRRHHRRRGRKVRLRRSRRYRHYRHKKRLPKFKNANDRQIFEVGLLYAESMDLKKSVHRKHMHISKRHRRSLQRQADRIYDQALTLDLEMPKR